MLEQNEDVHGIVAIVKLALDLIQIFTDIPLLQKVFLSNTMLRLFGPKPTDSTGVGKLMGMARELVASRFAVEAEAQNDLLVRRLTFRLSVTLEIQFKHWEAFSNKMPGLIPASRTGSPICRIRSHVPHHCGL